jgi:hypothetical protein
MRSILLSQSSLQERCAHGNSGGSQRKQAAWAGRYGAPVPYRPFRFGAATATTPVPELRNISAWMR